MIFQIILRNLSSDSHCWIWQKWSLRLRHEARKAGLGVQPICKPETRALARGLSMSRTKKPLGTGNPIEPVSWMRPRQGLALGVGVGKRNPVVPPALVLSCPSTSLCEADVPLQTNIQAPSANQGMPLHGPGYVPSLNLTLPLGCREDFECLL